MFKKKQRRHTVVETLVGSNSKIKPLDSAIFKIANPPKQVI